MKSSNETRGVILATSASLTLALSIAISKSLLSHISVIMMGLIWFSISTVFNLVIYMIRATGKSRQSRHLTGTSPGIFHHPPSEWMTVMLVAIPDAVASFLFFLAVQKMDNPAVVSFIGNLGPVLVTIAGIALLKERFGIVQVAGIIMTLAGVFLLSFSRERLFQSGSEYVLAAAFLFAASTIIARARKESLSIELLSLARSLILFLFCAIWFISQGEHLPSGLSILLLIAAGAFLESVLTILLNYEALRYIEATRTSLILSSKALWLLIIAYLFLDVIPPLYHVISGMLTITGLLLINFSPDPGKR